VTLAPDDWTTVSLWLAVIASGLYHGINPGMGWPLAVSAGLMGNGRRDLLAALGPLAGGHLLAMAVILLPFAALSTLVTWQTEIRIVAGLVVVAAGVYLLINRTHPRALARIKPTQLALWSFAIATAHGAGLMLVPIYLGICATIDTNAGHAAADQLISGNLAVALGVAVAHTLAMTVAGGALALGVYHWLGLKFLRQGWFNLDVVWAVSLILVGVLSLVIVH